MTTKQWRIALCCVMLLNLFNLTQVLVMVVCVLHEHLVHLETGYCFLNNLEASEVVAKGQNSMHAKITAPSTALA